MNRYDNFSAKFDVSEMVNFIFIWNFYTNHSHPLNTDQTKQMSKETYFASLWKSKHDTYKH